MVTHWTTDPVIMDNPLTRPSTHNMQRPQVFVKVEFGVSWSSQHPPRRHELQYKSRALRERHPNFPRHVPAPTTNYLAAAPIPPFEQHQEPQLYFQHTPQDHPFSPLNQQRDPQPPQTSGAACLQSEPYQQERGRSRHVEAVPEPPPLGPFPPQERGEAYADRPASSERHERGHSAPPPISENKWDVLQPETAAAHVSTGSSTACATTQHRSASDVWKELPEVPSRFRLGEAGMPWEGTWTFPMGFEPFLEPDPYLRPPSSSHAASPRPQSSSRDPLQERSPPQSTDPQQPKSPTTVVVGAIQSPTSPPGSSVRRDDPALREELEALASAMMTVDNGFENQWWNQGERRHLQAVVPPPATREQVQEQMALGWVGALLPPQPASSDVGGGRNNDSSSSRSNNNNNNNNNNNKRFSFESGPSPESAGCPPPSNMVVSPVSSYSGPVSNLSRSMSTRSDELWFTGGRYA